MSKNKKGGCFRRLFWSTLLLAFFIMLLAKPANINLQTAPLQTTIDAIFANPSKFDGKLVELPHAMAVSSAYLLTGGFYFATEQESQQVLPVFSGYYRKSGTMLKGIQFKVILITCAGGDCYLMLLEK